MKQLIRNHQKINKQKKNRKMKFADFLAELAFIFIESLPVSLSSWLAIFYFSQKNVLFNFNTPINYLIKLDLVAWKTDKILRFRNVYKPSIDIDSFHLPPNNGYLAQSILNGDGRWNLYILNLEQKSHQRRYCFNKIVNCLFFLVHNIIEYVNLLFINFINMLKTIRKRRKIYEIIMCRNNLSKREKNNS